MVADEAGQRWSDDGSLKQVETGGVNLVHDLVAPAWERKHADTIRLRQHVREGA